MTAIEGLVMKIQGDVRKSWVDFFKNKEMIQIRDAFNAGVHHANTTPKAFQATGMDYVREILRDSAVTQDDLPD
jgi:hypothetical protein